MDLLDRFAGWYARAATLRRALHGGGTTVPGVAVISVGALRAGGVGKSVMARAVADLLVAGGTPTAVVLRGYGGSAHGPREVTAGDSPNDVGDEAIEHAARAGGAWRVIVARKRLVGVALARTLGCRTVVLDDGFQHRAAARVLDLVMVAAGDLHAGVWPAGPLREPVETLSRAHLVATMDLHAPGQMLGRTVHPCTVFLAGWTDAARQWEPAEQWRGARALVVTAVARPERVTALLAAQGVSVVEHRQFADHAVVPTEAMEAGSGVDLVVVTGKDAARGALRGSRDAIPWRAAQVSVTVPAALRQALAGALARQLPGETTPVSGRADPAGDVQL